MALFLMLGTWQVERLGEKERLIANVSGALRRAAQAVPGVRRLAGLRCRRLRLSRRQPHRHLSPAGHGAGVHQPRRAEGPVLRPRLLGDDAVRPARPAAPCSSIAASCRRHRVLHSRRVARSNRVSFPSPASLRNAEAASAASPRRRTIPAASNGSGIRRASPPWPVICQSRSRPSMSTCRPGRRGPAAGRGDGDRVPEQPPGLRHHLVRLCADRAVPAVLLGPPPAGRPHAARNLKTKTCGFAAGSLLCAQPRTQRRSAGARHQHGVSPNKCSSYRRAAGRPCSAFPTQCWPASPAMAASMCPRPGPRSAAAEIAGYANRPYAEVAFDIIRRFVGGEIADADAAADHRRGLRHLPAPLGGAAGRTRARPLRARAVPRPDARLQGRGDAVPGAGDGP